MNDLFAGCATDDAYMARLDDLEYWWALAVRVFDDRGIGVDRNRGDALVADRHYELAQIQLNLFDCDKSLLRTFLDHSEWPVERDFPRRALAQAFRRQAVGLAQHRTMDVFHKLPQLLPLDDIVTLDELAEAVFGV